MKYLLVFLLFWAGSLQAQVLKKYTVGNSGCAAYFFCDPGKFELTKSPDSSDVYTGECSSDGVIYGIICIKLKDKTSDMAVGEGVLVSYLDYLKGVLNITGAAGYGKGHRLKGNENTRGIIDYWTDKDKANWKVKGWTNGSYIAVMYVSGAKNLPEQKINLFLDGLVLP